MNWTLTYHVSITNIRVHILIINIHAHNNNNNLFIGSDIHNIVIITSETPLVADLPLPTNHSFLISTFDPMGARIQMTLNILLSKFN